MGFCEKEILHRSYDSTTRQLLNTHIPTRRIIKCDLIPRVDALSQRSARITNELDDRNLKNLQWNMVKAMACFPCLITNVLHFIETSNQW